MWILANNYVVDLTAAVGCTDKIRIRARCLEDFDELIPGLSQFAEYTPGRDYPFRAEVPRQAIADVIHKQIMDIKYLSFKRSIKDPTRHHVYEEVWAVLGRGLQLVRSSFFGGPTWPWERES